MAHEGLDFEAPLVELRQRIEELEAYPERRQNRREISALRRRLQQATDEIFSQLDVWQVVQLARHLERPYTLDFIAGLIDDWVEMHGDRTFADDAAIVAGLGTFAGRSVAVVGHQKGRGTQERIRRNFGQPKPEGYRKALRVMRLADRHGLPILSFIDTPGAYPGLGAEERGQAEAIATNLLEMSRFRVPIVAVITGEGGSGGALALGVANRVLILQHAVYSVITPEGCAAILWRDQEMKAEAARAMRMTADDLLEHGIVDQIVPEPEGGAHNDPGETIRRVGSRLESSLRSLADLDGEALRQQRYERFRALGAYTEETVR